MGRGVEEEKRGRREEEEDKENALVPSQPVKGRRGEAGVLRPHPILSLTAMLEEEEEEQEGEGEAIPVEVIRSFLKSKEETALRRQELRWDQPGTLELLQIYLLSD